MTTLNVLTKQNINPIKRKIRIIFLSKKTSQNDTNLFLYGSLQKSNSEARVGKIRVKEFCKLWIISIFGATVTNLKIIRKNILI